ncbi:MAG: hypothetical protein ACRD3C_12015, partial [Vicinamibacterales bacterium]
MSVSSSRFTLTIEHLWLGLPVFVVMWKNFLAPLPLLDFWWHLKVGEVIATTGSIPDADLFSFTATGKPFVLQNWLAELGYYGVYRLGGLPMVVLFNALVALGAFLLVYVLCLEATSRLRLAVAVSVLAAFGIPGTIRPQVFSLLIFSLYYWVLMSCRARARNLVWTLPLLMMLWVNLHGAFVLGLGLVAFFIVSEGLRRLVHGEGANVLTPQELRSLGVVLAICALATLVNPEGYKIYDYLRIVMSDPVVQQVVTEWQPPLIDDMGAVLVFYLPFFLTVLAFVYARSKPDLTELGLFVGFGLLGLTSLR